MFLVIAYKDNFISMMIVMTTTYQLFSNTFGDIIPKTNSASANMGKSNDKENLKPSLIDEVTTKYINNVLKAITMLFTVTLNVV